MSRTVRTTTTGVLTLALAVAILTGCAPQPPTPEPEPGGPGDDGSSTQQPCVVGEWTLDVAAYQSDSEDFLRGMGLPVEGFDMSGSGIISFRAEGLVAADVDLTSSGTIVAGETRVPFNSPSRYQATGDWSVGDSDTLSLANWSSDVDLSVVTDPTAPDLPAIDYTDIPSVGMTCSSDELTLVVPGAPLSTTWHR